MVTVIGLGVKAGDVSTAALAAMKRADAVLVRNSSPVSDALAEEGVKFETLDALFQKCRNFDTLTEKIAREVLRREGNVCYLVEGSVTEDRAAALILKKCKNVVVLDGVSKADNAARRAGLCGAYTAVSAYELTEREVTLPLVVYDLTDKQLAGDVKLYLSERFGDEALSLFLTRESEKEIPLYEADRQKEEDYVCAALVIKEIPLLEKKRFSFADCVAILKRLRAPDGCPWDKVQTHESIRINAIEEAYELVDAIDRKDPERMCEEAGDVLMQALFHTLIEEEKGNFSVSDVTSGLCEKLVTRHTHVFGQDKAASADGALSVWDKNKMKEKGQKTFSDSVNDVPECFPALLRAQKICKRMAKGGWQFGNLSEIGARLTGLLQAIKEAKEREDRAAVQAALGDFLMCAAQVGLTVGEDGEQALLDSAKKGQARFTAFEKAVLADGKDVKSLTEEERLSYYVRAIENDSRD